MEYPDPAAVNTGLVVAYLERHHANKYLILNMSERQYQQVSSVRAEGLSSSGLSPVRGNPAEESARRPLFPTGTVIDVAYRGLPYPPLSLTLSLIMSVHKWLESDTGSILLVHCFKGFSRSITFLSAYLHWAGIAPSLQEAVRTLEAACGVDTTDPLVLLPSQKRFLRFFQQTCVKALITPQFRTKKLLRVLLNGVPSFFDPSPLGTVSPNPHPPGAPDSAEEESGLFRPVLEVWYQGQLVFSSLEPFLPPQSGDAARSEESSSLRLCEGAWVAPEAYRRLPVYSVSDGSVRFDVPGISLAGDVLLRLLHVAPQYESVDALHRSCAAIPAGCVVEGSCAVGGEPQTVVLAHGRKISTARVAFHTDMTKEGGYLEVRKGGMDGAVVLPSFPDDCFLSVFFEEQVRSEKAPGAENLKQCEDSRLLLQAREEGAAVRATRQQRAEEQRATEEARGGKEGVSHSGVDEEHQKNAQKRPELREHVQAYKEMAESWRLAGGVPQATNSNLALLGVRSRSPHGSPVKQPAPPFACRPPEEPIHADELGVLQARLTDEESEDEHDPADFVPSLDGVLPGADADVKTYGAGEDTPPSSSTPNVEVTQQLSLGRSACTGMATDKPPLTSDPVSAMFLVHNQLLKAESESEDGAESESDVSWGKEDDVGEAPDVDAVGGYSAAAGISSAHADGSSSTETRNKEACTSSRSRLGSPRRGRVPEAVTHRVSQSLEDAGEAGEYRRTETPSGEATLTRKENTGRQAGEQPPYYDHSTTITTGGSLSGSSNPPTGAGESALSRGSVTGLCAVAQVGGHRATVCQTASGERAGEAPVTELTEPSFCQRAHCQSEFSSMQSRPIHDADLVLPARSTLDRCSVSGGDAPLKPMERFSRDAVGAAVLAGSATEEGLPRSFGASGALGANEPSAVSSVKGSSEWTALASQSSSPVLVSSPGTPSSDGSSHVRSPQSEQDHTAEAIAPGESELVELSESYSSYSVEGIAQTGLVCASEIVPVCEARQGACGEADQESDQDRDVAAVGTRLGRERLVSAGQDCQGMAREISVGVEDEIPQLQAWQPKAAGRVRDSGEDEKDGNDVPELQRL